MAKKVCTLLLIAVAVRMDILLGTTYIRDAVCISFCLNELLSIVENTSLMGDSPQCGEMSRSDRGDGLRLGVPFPPAIKKAIDVLQTKVGRTDEENNKEEN